MKKKKSRKLVIEEGQELCYRDAEGNIHSLLFDVGPKPIFTADLTPEERLNHLLDEYKQIYQVLRRLFVL